MKGLKLGLEWGGVQASDKVFLGTLALGSSRIKARASSMSTTSPLWEATQKLLVRRRSELLTLRSPDAESNQNPPGLGRQDREPLSDVSCFSGPYSLVCQKEHFSLKDEHQRSSVS